MKYLKALLLTIVPIFFIVTISSTLCYFDLISTTINKVIMIIFILLLSFSSGIYIGFNSNQKGYLEGLKIGLAIVLLMFLVSYFVFNNSLTVTKTIYYIAILIMSIIGSIIGINKKLKAK